MNFQKDGYSILYDSIPIEDILELQNTANEFLDYFLKKNSEDMKNDTIEMKMEKLENLNSEDFRKICDLIGTSLPVQKISTNDEIIKKCKKYLNSKTIFSSNGTTFYNHPEVQRLQYDWHTEKPYYPYCDELITLWYPWVHEVNEKNGTMVIAKGRNKEDYQVKKDKWKKGQITQMRIDGNLFNEKDIVHCNLSLGDCILFSSRCPHKTGFNSTSIPRVSLITRYGKVDYGVEHKEGK